MKSQRRGVAMAGGRTGAAQGALNAGADVLRALAGQAPPSRYIRVPMPEMSMRAPGPPPAPPPPLPPPAAARSEALERYDEFLRRLDAAPPPQEGMTRLYRVGETATQYQPPKTVRMFGQDIPYEQFLASKRTQEGFNPNPEGAAGRWATDAPRELDFYIGDNAATAPIYRFDLPTSEVSQYNVRNTPFLQNSRNPAREFVLPDKYLEQAVRMLTLGAPIAAGAMRDQQ
jgi:hypothetical protein